MTPRTMVAVGIRWLGAYFWPVVLLAAMIVAIVLWRSDHQPVPIPPAVQHTQDSLAITRPLDSVAIASAHQSSVRNEQSAASRSAVVAATVSIATTMRHTADSLALVAQAATDSTDAWRRTAMAYKAEGDSLRSALKEQTRAVVDLRTALADARRETKIEHDRRVAVEDQNTKLAEAVVRASQCRVIGPIPCPTRAESFVVGALATGIYVLAK